MLPSRHARQNTRGTLPELNPCGETGKLGDGWVLSGAAGGEIPLLPLSPAALCFNPSCAPAYSVFRHAAPTKAGVAQRLPFILLFGVGLPHCCRSQTRMRGADSLRQLFDIVKLCNERVRSEACGRAPSRADP